MDQDFVIRLVTITLGCIVLLAGRNVFWLVVSVIGFLFGVQLGQLVLAGHAMAIIVLGGIALGVLGIVAAILFERVAFALAGLFAGAYLAIALCDAIGIAAPPLGAVAVAGAIGAVIAALVMDWAIIVMSAFCGAVAIVAALRIPAPLALAAIGTLAVLGIFVQQAILRRRRPPPG